MNALQQQSETPKQRLEHIARSNKPFRRELWGPKYLIAVGLLLLLLVLVVVGSLGGMLGSDVIRGYARRIFEASR